VKILVVDDERAVRDSLRRALELQGYEVELAEDGAQALARLGANGQPDAVVLDILMPGIDGLEVCREIRRSGSAVPVLMLTARDAIGDRVEGLDAGADDYLVKPFHYPELAARIENVLRRRAPRREGPRRIGELFIDPSTREVRVGGRRVELANKEFALLRALAAEPHRVFAKEELLRDVWGFQSMGRTRTLDSHASRLRRKLDPQAARFVINCWGVGYRLIEP
jgi:two-component system, OmpR family, response regulator MprA